MRGRYNLCMLIVREKIKGTARQWYQWTEEPKLYQMESMPALNPDRVLSPSSPLLKSDKSNAPSNNKTNSPQQDQVKISAMELTSRFTFPSSQANQSSHLRQDNTLMLSSVCDVPNTKKLNTHQSALETYMGAFHANPQGFSWNAIESSLGHEGIESTCDFQWESSNAPCSTPFNSMSTSGLQMHAGYPTPFMIHPATRNGSENTNDKQAQSTLHRESPEIDWSVAAKFKFRVRK